MCKQFLSLNWQFSPWDIILPVPKAFSSKSFSLRITADCKRFVFLCITWQVKTYYNTSKPLHRKVSVGLFRKRSYIIRRDGPHIAAVQYLCIGISLCLITAEVRASCSLGTCENLPVTRSWLVVTLDNPFIFHPLPLATWYFSRKCDSDQYSDFLNPKIRNNMCPVSTFLYSYSSHQSYQAELQLKMRIHAFLSLNHPLPQRRKNLNYFESIFLYESNNCLCIPRGHVNY